MTDLTLFLLHFTEEGQTSDAVMVFSAGLKAGNPSHIPHLYLWL